MYARAVRRLRRSAVWTPTRSSVHPSTRSLPVAESRRADRRATQMPRFGRGRCAVSQASRFATASGLPDHDVRHAHPEDERGCGAAQRQPEHAARVGAPLRLSQAAALGRPAPPLHARRGRRAARRAAAGPVDLLGRQPRTRGAEHRHAHARRRARRLRARPRRQRDGVRARAALRRALRRGGPAARRSTSSASASALDSAPWAFAARWADGWLRRAQRLAPPPSRPLAILVGDATRNELDPDALGDARLRAVLRPRRRARHGAAGRAASAASATSSRRCRRTPSSSPAAIVSDDDVARWAYRVRAASGQLPTALFRRTHHGAKVRSAAGARVLPDTPFGAQRQLLALIDDRSDDRFERRRRAAAAIDRQARRVARHRHEEAARRPARSRSTSAASSSCPSAGTAACRRRPSVESRRLARLRPLRPRARPAGAVRPRPARRRAVPRHRLDAVGLRRVGHAPRSCSAPTRRWRSTGTSPTSSSRPTRTRRARENLLVLLVDAASGSGEPRTAVVRPRSEFGVRFRARIGPCGPPHAALLVLAD